MPTPESKLKLAKEHLDRVQSAWDPPDWADLSLYGFYALEAAVGAAALHKGIEVQKAHWARVETARTLHTKYKLPDVADLLRDLNESRKSVAYGDVDAPELVAENVASEVELFIDAVEELLES